MGRANWRSMYSSHASASDVVGHISRICPSMNTASGSKGGRGVKAHGTSSLRHAIHDESMVISAHPSRGGAYQPRWNQKKGQGAPQNRAIGTYRAGPGSDRSPAPAPAGSADSA